jgi:hypothetical protein
VGGGLFNNAGATSPVDSTVAYNSTGKGYVGGVAIEDGTVTSRGSIVADNTAGSGYNCLGMIIDGGYNLESGISCGFRGTSSLQKTNPQFAGALADNDGLTQNLVLRSVAPPSIRSLRLTAS